MPANSDDAIDWDALLQSTAAEAFEAVTDCSRLSLGDLAHGIARTSSLEKGLLRGDSSIPDQFRDVNLGEVLNSFVTATGSPKKCDDAAELDHKRPRRTSSLRKKVGVDVGTQGGMQGGMQVQQSSAVVANNSQLSVAQMVDYWVRDHTRSLGVTSAPSLQGGSVDVSPSGRCQEGVHPPVVVSGVPLGPGVMRSAVPQLMEADAAARKKPRVGGRQAKKKDERSVKNRKSAAKSRMKRAEYTKELEERAKLLKDTNMQLRKKIVDVGKAMEAEKGSLEGKQLRKTRTLPANFKV